MTQQILCGAGLVQVKVSGQYIQHIVGSGTAVAGFEWRAAGNYKLEGVTYTFLESWLVSGAAADYQVMFTPTTGAVSVGSAATATWLTANATHLWRRIQASLGGSDCLGTLQVRRVSDSVVVASCTIELYAERS